MKHTDFYHKHQAHRLAKHEHPDLRLFEVSIWLHTLARSFIAVFVPIILLDKGYELKEIFIYLLIYNTVDVPLNFVVYRFIKKYGAFKAMILGTIFTIIFFSILGIIPPENFKLILALSLTAALYDTLFWVAHIYIFMEVTGDEKDMGTTVGVFESIRRFGSIPGPLIGAFILVEYGSFHLSALSILIFAASIYPLYKIKTFQDKPTEQKISPKTFFSKPHEKRNFALTALTGLHDEVEGVLLPIYIYLVFSNIEKVAFIPVIISFTTTFLTFEIGKLVKKYEIGMAVIGAVTITLIWVYRIFSKDPDGLYITLFLVNIVSLFLGIPLSTELTKRGKETGHLASSTYRNAVAMAPKALLYIVLLFFTEYFAPSFWIALATMPIILWIVLKTKNLKFQ